MCLKHMLLKLMYDNFGFTCRNKLLRLLGTMTVFCRHFDTTMFITFGITRRDVFIILECMQ